MTPSKATETRILVGAGSFADAEAALQILRLVTGQLRVALGGMLVVDQDALALCRIPHQRVISLSGTMVIAPDPRQVSTLIEADAKAFQRALASLADPIGASWVFERSMGDPVRVVLQAAATWDVIVLGHRAVHPVRGKVVVIAAAGSENAQLANFASSLSTAAARVDFKVGDSPAPFATVDQALSALARTNAEAVLVDLSCGLFQDPADLHRLLDVARCPVFVFSANSAERHLEHSTQIPTPSSDKRDGDGN